MSNNRHLDLCVVMPVYNEQAAIQAVVGEWISALRQTGTSFVLLAINDGSKDGTARLLDEMSDVFPELEAVHRVNEGHGRSCLYGYRTALERGARWVFQIDSDGQCNPAFFSQFWELRNQWSLIFGYRARRDDGWGRFLVSRVLSLVILSASGTWIWDANVPYRLMKTEWLQTPLKDVPPGEDLSNVLVAYVLRRDHQIKWVSIRFRERQGGTSTLRLGKLPGLAGQMFRAIRALRQPKVESAIAPVTPIMPKPEAEHAKTI